MTHEWNNLDFPDEVTGRRFSQVLHAEADAVEPAGGSLALIQARAATAPRVASRWRWAAPLAAAAVVATVAVGAVLAPNDGPTTVTPPGASFTPSPTDAAPSLTPSPSVSQSSPKPSTSSSASGGVDPEPSSSGGGGTGAACIGAGDRGYAYFASDLNGRGPRLYRGTVVVSCHLGIEETLTVPAGKDPDFTSLWPAGTTVRSLKINGNVATVDLDNFPSASAALETAAVQQLVWTVTANDNSIASVRVLVNGAPPVGARDWSSPVRRANAFSTLSNVWIISPGNGATVSSPLTVRVYGTGYEGQVPLKVFQDGTEVASTYVTTEQGAFAEATATFDLPPGTYEVRAYNDNGQDDSLDLWDTKVVVIS